MNTCGDRFFAHRHNIQQAPKTTQNQSHTMQRKLRAQARHVPKAKQQDFGTYVDRIGKSLGLWSPADDARIDPKHDTPEQVVDKVLDAVEAAGNTNTRGKAPPKQKQKKTAKTTGHATTTGKKRQRRGARRSRKWNATAGRIAMAVVAVALVAVSGVALHRSRNLHPSDVVSPAPASAPAPNEQQELELAAKEYFQKHLENQMISWKKKNPNGDYYAFLKEFFPENIRFNQNNTCIWVDKRVLGVKWNGAFHRVKATDDLHQIGAPPTPSWES